MATETGAEQAAPRRSGRPSLEEAERLTDRVLDAATRLFMEQGFGATSVEAIAAAAGISKRTFYSRYPGKPQVFEAVILRYVRRYVRPAEDVAPADLPLEERLYRVATQLLGWILEPDVIALYRLTIAEVARFPELARSVADFAIADAVQALEGVFAADGAEDDARFVAEQFMQAVAAFPFFGAVQGRETPGLDAAKQARVRRAIALFLRGWQPAISKSPSP
ncbi:TetR/AcrR family transcriptional regulator [Pseudomonas sp. LS44]|uniref:TetR/AcrR family transcriptional regulator n=1 Tax=Pseudomonas sp. LS44 TaxID=1357074 RepID=UPI00215AF58E|nr:TetR/AcrR family transcriptional regulator [Pseudomonas sp. LS44]UVE18401.1 TetR/AcrR family transcriptional regulator [Pseudomonas sp. LS44]